jgi:hypothetical protein
MLRTGDEGDAAMAELQQVLSQHGTGEKIVGADKVALDAGDGGFLDIEPGARIEAVGDMGFRGRDMRFRTAAGNLTGDRLNFLPMVDGSSGADGSIGVGTVTTKKVVPCSAAGSSVTRSVLPFSSSDETSPVRS